MKNERNYQKERKKERERERERLTFKLVSRSHWKIHLFGSLGIGVINQHPGPFSPLTKLFCTGISENGIDVPYSNTSNKIVIATTVMYESVIRSA